MAWTIASINNLNLDIQIPSIFVETGSYLGNGIQSAIDSGIYKTIHSIELSEKWAGFCSDRFKKNENIIIHQGDSASVLQTLHLPAEPVVFFLDAHYSGGETAGSEIDNGCPILRELEVISNRNVAGDIIFIDDMRLMGKKTWSGIDGTEYPLTQFDFSHATEYNMYKIFEKRKIINWSEASGLVSDRLIIVLG